MRPSARVVTMPNEWPGLGPPRGAAIGLFGLWLRVQRYFAACPFKY
jgi:hypothetical protein